VVQLEYLLDQYMDAWVSSQLAAVRSFTELLPRNSSVLNHRVNPVEIFLAVVTSAAPIGNIRPASRSPEFVSKIHEVSFYGLNTSLYDDLSAISDLSFPTGSAQYGPDQPDALIRDAPPAQAPVYEHPCAPLTKILESGTFYYATQPPWDLSTRLGKRMVRQKAGIHGKDLSVIDDRFVWNEYIVRSLLDFRDRLEAHEREELDRCQFIVRYRGSFVESSFTDLCSLLS
jgi:hypothetical protein